MLSRRIRLSNVDHLISQVTDSLGTTKVKDGEYSYYPSNRILQLKLGATPIQTVNYTYNNRGWLTKINDPEALGTNSFGMTLGYNVRDKVGLAFPFTAQNNGNISWVAYRMSGVNLPYGATDYVGRAFTYDSTNRLLSAPLGCYYGSSWHSAGSRYAESSSYSDDGNFVKLGRHDSTSALTDSLSYSYTSGTNQLASYTNSAGSGSTYTYDANGNVVSDSRSNIAFTIYDINNLPIAIYTTTGQSQVYAYDVNGARVRKYASNGTDTYYLNDPAGKTELVQQGVNNSLYTYNIYGRDNIGQVMRNSPRLWRYYYLKDHLGSVRMIVNSSGGVDSYSDLYPYGLLMPGRSATTSADARYKFTGKERDVETNYDYFGARYYDARVGRFLSCDRFSAKYPSFSPFSYGAGNPFRYLDINGDSLWATDNGETFLITQGSKYEGKSKTIKAAVSDYQKIAKNKAGKAVLSSLEGSKSNYTLELVEDLAEPKGGEFRPSEGGGGILAMSASGLNVEGIAHESFHAFQSESGNGASTVLSEVEAYLFGAAMSGNRQFGNDNFGAGGSYQTFMTQLLNKWSAPTFWDAVYSFKDGSLANRKGTYADFPFDVAGQHTIIDALYPLTNK